MIDYKNSPTPPPWKLRLLFILFITLIPTLSLVTLAQDSYQQFYTQSLKTTNTGMYILGSWAISNMVTGGYGWSTGTGQSKYFHQMNFFWNSVNLAIAGTGLYTNYRLDYSLFTPEEIMGRHTRMENILLINAGLDLAYIGTGFLLRHLSSTSTSRGELLKGYGNSIILQGGFLLVFDAVLYGILRNQRSHFLEGINLSFSPNSFLVSFQF